MTDENHTPSKEEAWGRINFALARLEAAQNLLGDACARLSRVTYPEHHWELVSKAYDELKQLHREIREKIADYDMDSTWKRDYE